MASNVNSTPSLVALNSGLSWNEDNTRVDDVKLYSSAIISITATQPSANAGIVCRWSMDGINFDFFEYFTIDEDDYNITQAEYIKTITVDHKSRYFNIYYVNGSANCNIRIQTIYKTTPQDIKIEHRSISDTIWHTDHTGANGESPILPIHNTSVLFLGVNDSAVDSSLYLYASALETGPYYNTGMYVQMTGFSPCYQILTGIFPYIKLYSSADISLSLKYVVIP